MMQNPQQNRGPQSKAGWYPDRERPGLERFWDGQVWTKRLRQVAATRQKLRRITVSLIASVGAALLVGLIVLVAVTPTDASVAQPAAAESASATPTAGRQSSTPTPTPTVRSLSATPRPSRSTEPTKAATPKATTPKESTPVASPGSALAAAQTLTVKGRAPRSGYDRALYGQAWSDIDRNGCDQRNDVLRRDLTDYTTKSGTNGCLVLTGRLSDPYTENKIKFVRGTSTSAAVQIDHVVALSDGWQKGAQQWDVEKRERFANDFLNLIAVDGPTNASKSDGDTATWLPPNKKYRCTYVARQVAVKESYGLWVTKAEQAAMVRVLTTCPDLKLPTAANAPDLDRSTEVRPPAPRKTKEAQPQKDDIYYENCSAVRDAGKAPIHRGDPGYASHLDRDGDGVGCESEPADVPEEPADEEEAPADAGDGGSTNYENCTAVRDAGAAPIRRGDPGYGSHLDRDGDGVACE